MAKITKVRKRCAVCGKVKMVKPRVRTCWRKRDGFSIYACGGKLELAPIQRAVKAWTADRELTAIDRDIAKAKAAVKRHNASVRRASTLARKWERKQNALERKRDSVAASLVTIGGVQVRTGALTDHRARGIALGGDE